MIPKTPLIITDKNGTIIYCNEAAHNICAAVSFGNSVEKLFNEAELGTYKLALSSALHSFSVKSSALGGAELIFDLTKERRRGVRYIRIKNLSLPSRTDISYESVANDFMNAVYGKNLSGRRFTELYETLASDGCVFGSCRHLAVFGLRELTDRFYKHIIPKLLSVYGNIFTSESGITDESVVYAEPYGLYLAVSAMMSAAAYVSDGNVSLHTEDRGDTVTFEVSAPVTRGLCGDEVHLYGVHYVDLLYAETLARASGYGFTYENNRGNGNVCLTLSVKCRDYYPAYLKAKSSASKNAAMTASLFPFSAKEQDNEHQ